MSLQHAIILTSTLVPFAQIHGASLWQAPAAKATHGEPASSANRLGPATKLLDRRLSSSVVEYRLLVVARKRGGLVAWPGHLYFLAGRYDAEREACDFDSKDAFGFAPSRNTPAVWFNLPAAGGVQEGTVDDLNVELMTHRLEIRIDAAGYAALRQAAEDFARRHPEYQVSDENCVRFVLECLNGLRAATQGAPSDLVVPTRGRLETPAEYLTRLLDANGVE